MKNIPLILIVFFVWSCANIRPPSGGPEDKTAPVIAEFLPANASINYTDNKISMTFNKWMNRPSVKENIFISPSVKFETDWSGKDLEIEFIEPLQENTTYSFTLGTEYTDWKNNKPDEAFNLIFSTGSQIDSGYISGKIHDPKPEGKFIYAYKVDRINADTIDYSVNLPDYWTQVGANGKFKLNALKDGTYRLIAASDEYKDNIFTKGVDEFGTAQSDIIVKNYKPDTEVNLITGPPLDRIGPALADVRALFSDYIELNFSEDIDRENVNIGIFEILYSKTAQKIGIASFDFDKTDKKKVFLRLDTPLDTSQIIKFEVLDNDRSIRDTFGLHIQDSARTAEFFGTYLVDETIPTVLVTGIQDSSENEMPFVEINIFFNLGISNDIQPNIKFIELETEFAVEYDLVASGSNTFMIKPKSSLNLDSWYKFEANFDSIVGSNGVVMRDTNVIISFKTVDSRRFSKLSGTLDAVDCSGNYIIGLIDKKGKLVDTTKVNAEMKWRFDPVKTGEFTILIFCDRNNDGIMNYGNTDPFQFSEKFKIIDKKVEVKSRWELEDIKLSFE